MSSGPLDPSNDYKFDPAPAEAVLDRDAWNGSVGHLASRVRALETQRVEVQAVIDELRLFGLDRLNTALEPVIAEQEAKLAELDTQLAAVKAEVESIVADLTAMTQSRLDALDAQLVDVEAQFNVILAAGIGADRVIESATRKFVTPEEKDKIASALQSIPDATETEKGSVELATQAEAEAGTSTSVVMTPLRTAQAIAALGGNVVKTVFTESGTFTKEPDDIAYYVEALGAGGGGGSGRTNASVNMVSTGGAGGSCGVGFLDAEEIPNSVTVTVGSGGLGGVAVATASYTAGQSGGDSAFGTFVRGSGGAGGNYSGSTNPNAPETPGDYRGAPRSFGSGTTGGNHGGSAGGSGGYVGAFGTDPSLRNGFPGGSPGQSAGGGGAGGVHTEISSQAWSSGNGADGGYLCGGGGGSSSSSGYPSGRGGNGGVGGGGGAGGQRSSDTLTNLAGNGGNGGRGEVRVWRIKK